MKLKEKLANEYWDLMCEGTQGAITSAYLTGFEKARLLCRLNRSLRRRGTMKLKDRLAEEWSK